MNDKKKKPTRKTTYDKPVSLTGASFKDIVGALLKTPKPEKEEKMITAIDVAYYILKKYGVMTAMKLQKLVYYSQVWTLVWDEEPLFENEIQAWANGAVIPDLFVFHKRMFKINTDIFEGIDINQLSDPQKENVDKVFGFYGDYTAQQLSDINHQEDPWINARGDLPPMEISNNEITHGDIFEYHSGIWNAGEKNEAEA